MSSLRQTVMGTYDPETRWRASGLSSLPALADRDREPVVLCMDELLFPFCGPDDVLYTRCRIHDDLRAHLDQLGFKFQSRHVFDWSAGQIAEPPLTLEQFKPCIFRLAARQGRSGHGHTAGEARQYVNAGARDAHGSETSSGTAAAYGSDGSHVTGLLSPYAITEDTAAYLSVYPPVKPLPLLEAVIKVNSKFYSNRMLQSLGEKAYGIEVHSAAEVESLGQKLLDQGAYLIKDPFGVSGKGNLLIDSSFMQSRVASHLRKQEESGLTTRFLLEPFLAKETDFSSQWLIRDTGTIELISVQRMINHQLNYGGSMTADSAFADRLDKAGYFNVLEQALGRMFEDGYHGFVCVDSMILQGGELVPIVEINARKSMGLINAYLDRFWNRFDKQGWLTFLSVGLPSGFKFDSFMHTLRDSELLLQSPEGYGVMLLSSNTLTINETLAQHAAQEGSSPRRGLSKGRLYVSVVGRDEEHRSEIMTRLRGALSDMSVKIYN